MPMTILVFPSPEVFAKRTLKVRFGFFYPSAKHAAYFKKFFLEEKVFLHIKRAYIVRKSDHCFQYF